MKSNIILIIVLVALAFATGGTSYFYSQSKNESKRLSQLTDELSKLKSAQKEAEKKPAVVASAKKEVKAEKPKELQGPILSKSRASNPRLTHSVEQGETLYSISSKQDLLWTDLVLANGLENADDIKAGDVLIIPEIDKYSKTNQITYALNTEDLEKFQKNSQFTESWRLSALEVAKNESAPVYGLNSSRDYQLKKEDFKTGVAIVSALVGEGEYEITLSQPLKKGKGQIWAVKVIKKVK